MALILGIESSCDETAAALVDARRPQRIVAQRIASQDEAHRPYGGVVPEIAARAHVERLTPLIAAALADAGMTLADVDAIAATAGPGLIGGVMVGLVTAKALAMASGQAADRGQPPRRPCAVARAWPIRRSIFPICCCWSRAGIARSSRRGRRPVPPPCHHHRRCAGRGLRQDRQDPRARLSRRPGGRAAGARGRSAGGASAAPAAGQRANRISRSPGSRARCCARSRAGSHCRCRSSPRRSSRPRSTA